MPAIVIVGAQWGDEGKGKATDLLGDDMDYVVLTQELAAVPRSSLRRTIGSLAEWRDEITRALDVLFIGF